MQWKWTLINNKEKIIMAFENYYYYFSSARNYADLKSLLGVFLQLLFIFIKNHHVYEVQSTR